MGLGFSSGFRFGFVPSPFQSVGFCQTARVPIVSFCTFINYYAVTQYTWFFMHRSEHYGYITLGLYGG